MVGVTKKGLSRREMRETRRAAGRQLKNQVDQQNS
jgi:hypothetical protein